MVHAIALVLWLLTWVSAPVDAFSVYQPITRPLAFTECDPGVRWVANAENFDYGSGVTPYTVVPDPTATGASTGHLLLPIGEYYAKWQTAVGISFTCDPCYLGIEVQTFSNEHNRMWFDTTIFPSGSVLPNTKATVLNNDLLTTGWTVVPVGARTTHSFSPKIDDISPRAFTLTNGGTLFVAMQPGIAVNRLVASTTPGGATNATCAVGTPVADYEIYETDTLPTVDATIDAIWTNATVVPQRPGAYNDGVNGWWVIRALWNKDSTPQRMCLLGQKTLANMEALSSGEDSINLIDDTYLTVRMRAADTTTTLDANTYRFTVTAKTSGPLFYDGRYDGVGNAFSTTYDFTNRSAAASYIANALVIETCFDLPFTLSTSTPQLVQADFIVAEKVTGTGAKYALAFGPTLCALCGNAKFLFRVDDVPTAPGDSTGPVVGAPAFSNVTATGFTVTCSAADAESGVGACQAQYDTDNDNAVSGGDVSGLIAGAMNGGNCQTVVTGLAAGTAYEAVCKATNGIGLVTSSSVGDQTTSAGGATVYIAPGGSDATGNGSSGNPWKTLLYACAPARLVAGGTILMKTGTYPPQGTLTATTCRDGTAAQPITIRAETERLAYIAGTDTPTENLMLSGLHYYTIEGLRISNARFANGRSHTFRVSGSTNMTVKKLLLHGTNRAQNGQMLWVTNSTNVLVEQNELYGFHRHGIQFYHSDNNVARRNYLMGVISPPLAGDYLGHPPYDISDEGMSAYPGNNNIFENNLSHRVEVMAGVNSVGGCETSADNKIIGNIGYIPQHAWWTGVKPGTSAACTPQGTIFEQNVAIDTVGNGALYAVPKGTLSRNNTVWNSAANAFYTKAQAGSAADGILNVVSTNDLAVRVTAGGATGFKFTVDAGTLTFDIMNPGSFGYAPAFTPLAGDPHITGEMLTNPALETPICIPLSSPYVGQGTAGGNIGASVLYQYRNGVLTGTKLWTITKPDATFAASASGVYPNGVCGAKVAGVNDTAGTGCYSIADRLMVTAARINNCVAGYF